MASYHYDKNKGGMVKCHTAEPNGVCRIHGNSDVQANSAEEAQHKYNEMKCDEAKAEDMSEMPSEYAIEVWKVHCDSINDGNDDGMGPKTIDVIAHMPGIWENLNDDEKQCLANNYIDDSHLQYKTITDNAPDGVWEYYGYKRAEDVILNAYNFAGINEVSDDDMESHIHRALSRRDTGIMINDGYLLPDYGESDEGTVWVHDIDSYIEDDIWDDIKWNNIEAGCYDDVPKSAERVADDEGYEVYEYSPSYQTEVTEYYKSIGRPKDVPFLPDLDNPELYKDDDEWESDE